MAYLGLNYYTTKKNRLVLPYSDEALHPKTRVKTVWGLASFWVYWKNVSESNCLFGTLRNLVNFYVCTLWNLVNFYV